MPKPQHHEKQPEPKEASEQKQAGVKKVIKLEPKVMKHSEDHSVFKG